MRVVVCLIDSVVHNSSYTASPGSLLQSPFQSSLVLLQMLPHLPRCTECCCGDTPQIQPQLASLVCSAWDITTCNAAAAGGHLEVLHWCRSQQPPAPWGDSTAAAAAAAGHLAVLQWLLKPYTTLRDITSSSLNTPYPTSDQMWQHSLVKAGQTCAGVKQQQEKQRFGVGGGVQGLCNGFVRPEACPWAPWLRCAVAARAGQLHVLRWLRAHGASWDAGGCLHNAS
eukprot:GHUV01042862.1.p1 GENE.GHUV01042862.1~~GHUV01042862.1.p1  ORF type:complete len:226 (-),score=41.89 GHUV01042862.1:131-808(-)